MSFLVSKFLHRVPRRPSSGTNSDLGSERQASDRGGLRGIDLAAVKAKDRKADVSRERL